ncbi:MAG: ABC transporter ATP-binding protein [Clostridia bacterium]|nr:ABC transporter ATP-binding protein [Clostridia bacterium]
MRRYFKYLKGSCFAVLLAPLMMILEVYCDLRQPELMSAIVDDGIRGGLGSSYILSAGGRMLLVALVGFAGGALSLVFATIASQNFGRKLRSDAFSKVQSFSFANIDDFSSASLVTRITNDVVFLQTIVAMALRMFVRAPMTFFGGIWHALMIKPQLAAIIFIAIPLLLAVLILTIRKAFPIFKTVQAKLDKVNAVIQENLTGIRVVKAYNRAQHENDRFGKANMEFASLSIRAQQIMALMMPLLTLIMNAAVVSVLWFGANLVGADEIQVGEVSALITYITRILGSLMMMSMMFTSASRAQASAERINAILDENIDIMDPDQPTTRPITRGDVEFRDVSFRYKGAAGDAVKNISFTVKGGETVAILGSTGSGKSTLVNLIPRLYDVTSGAVLVDGVDVRNYRISDLRSAVGVVLQDNILFSGSIAENLRWGDENATEEELSHAAKMAQAEEFITANPDGYNAVLSQRGVNFSGGQKQRMAIARALVKKPKVLILDDSTSALDMTTESKIRKTLKTELSKMTVIIIAQRISSARNADKIMVMENGKIVDCGTHDYLLGNSRVYKEIYDSQLQADEEVHDV